ncbi:MAG: PqqD family protein [Actinomycetes bacterium]
MSSTFELPLFAAPRHAPTTVVEPIGDDCVVWFDDERTLHLLNRVGRAAWQRVDGQTTYLAIAHDVVSAAGHLGTGLADMHHEVLGFLADLRERRLIVDDAAPSFDTTASQDHRS